MIPVPVNGGKTFIDVTIPDDWWCDDKKYGEICAVGKKFNGEYFGASCSGDYTYDVAFLFPTVKDAVAFWKYCTKKYKQMENYNFYVYGGIGSNLNIDRKKIVLVPNVNNQDDAICEITIFGDWYSNNKIFDKIAKKHDLSNIKLKLRHNKNKQELVCYKVGVNKSFLNFLKGKKASVVVYAPGYIFDSESSAMFVNRGNKSVPVEVII